MKLGPICSKIKKQVPEIKNFYDVLDEIRTYLIENKETGSKNQEIYDVPDEIRT